MAPATTARCATAPCSICGPSTGWTRACPPARDSPRLQDGELLLGMTHCLKTRHLGTLTEGIAWRLTSYGGADVNQFGVGEEASDELGQTLKPAQPRDHDRLHLLGASGSRARHAVAFHVLPHPLVRVELRGVSGQPV